MSLSETPCFSLAIAPLTRAGSAYFAIHVIKAPLPNAYVLHDCVWTETLTNLWQSWQDMFSTRRLPNVPHVSDVNTPPPDPIILPIDLPSAPNPPIGLSGRLMQDLGISLWRWLFDGQILTSFKESYGIARGQDKPLRLRLEIRDPDLIALPWEIMQDGAGRQAISLSQQLLFSRTTSDVYTLPTLRTDHILKILLVLGQDTEPGSEPTEADVLRTLKLQQEATALTQVLQTSGNSGIGGSNQTPCQVDTLVQPTSAELIQALETRAYNVLFYAGHGAPAPDGGLLFLRPDMTLNGTELAQVLTRCQVKLAVFNACWGAQPDHYLLAGVIPGSDEQVAQLIPRSSLAEVLIHHGVPAVLAMRDSITDKEALSFIQAFAKALAERMPIDQAVAVARQHLLTLYKFNQQAWTLPVLYMHPEFDGELLKSLEMSPTMMPANTVTRIGNQDNHRACLRSLKTARVWQIRGGLMRVGRDRTKNDLVLEEDEGGVSREHAVIFRRDSSQESNGEATYFLEDISRFGTWVLHAGNWQKVHRQEVQLHSGSQLKFGSSQNETLEFILDQKPSS